MTPLELTGLIAVVYVVISIFTAFWLGNRE